MFNEHILQINTEINIEYLNFNTNFVSYYDYIILYFQTADELTVNINRNITASRQPVRQLRYVVYLHSFVRAQQIMFI